MTAWARRVAEEWTWLYAQAHLEHLPTQVWLLPADAEPEAAARAFARRSLVRQLACVACGEVGAELGLGECQESILEQLASVREVRRDDGRDERHDDGRDDRHVEETSSHGTAPDEAATARPSLCSAALGEAGEWAHRAGRLDEAWLYSNAAAMCRA